MHPIPRHLHPGAWWLWAVGLATAASRTTNPVLLLLIAAVAGYVVAARRTTSPSARAYIVFLRLGLLVIAIRVVLASLFGAALPGHTLLTLPQVALPDWAPGVRIGGPITLEGVAAAGYQGLRLAVMLVCIGAANALASPARLLRCAPGALYEVGVAVVVAMTFAPQVIATVSRVRAARRLRGRPNRGLRGIRGVAMPVLEGALERSLEVAASMDSRGYGRSGGLTPAARRLTAALTLAGLVGVAAGSYGLLDSGSPGLLGLPAIAFGALLAVAGLAVGGRRTVRTRYRPDRWLPPEWAVVACGVAIAATFIAIGGTAALQPSVSPLQAPGLPLLAAVGLLVALLPSWLAPSVPGLSAR
ncbi:MAG: energy-coupling factor transporter transmembrane protein EcfT [Actinomycetota bacterium]|nr:energy-coupling factor transporter transmembrane protein EcfT [Actinomycetota bacterium]